MPEMAAPSDPSRVGGRLAMAGLAVVLLAGSGAFLQRGLGPNVQPMGHADARPTGSWYCPHGGGEDWKVWVVITNPTAGSVTIRATTFGETGRVTVSDFAIAPHRQVYREVPATEPGASTQVEYFGGWVGTGAVIRSSGKTPATAAERCAGAPRPTWLLPDELTGRGQTAYLVVMNPFAQIAQFDVIIRTEKRSGQEAVRPGPLSPFVIEPGGSVGIRLNRYALQGPGERTVSAQVAVRSGRVVAGGVGVSAGVLRAEVGAPIALRRMALPAASFESGPDLAMMNPATDRSEVLVIGQTGRGQSIVSDVDGVSVGADGVRTISLGKLEGVAVVNSTNGHPVAAALRMTGASGDLATVGAAGAAARWLVLPSLPPPGGQAFLVLENPGREPATVSISFIGPKGPIAAPGLASRTIQPGRVFQLDLSRALSSDPVSVLIESADGGIVAGTSSTPEDGAGYAATLGIPVPALAGDLG